MNVMQPIAAAKDARAVELPKAVQKVLKDYQKRMANRITAETRALLKQRFPYPIFLYEAEKVGITATGDANQSELIPNDSLPPGIAQPCLELYREFQRDPTKFFLTVGRNGGGSRDAGFCGCERVKGIENPELASARARELYQAKARHNGLT